MRPWTIQTRALAVAWAASLAFLPQGSARAAEESPTIGAGVSWPAPPSNLEEVHARMKEIRGRYEPFLRSLPAPLDVRRRRTLDGPWRAKFEVAQAADGTRPTAPDWFREDLDDSAWEPVVVPEWRYGGADRKPTSCILWYRTTFSGARPPQGRRAVLNFAGVQWEAEVWLNGRSLGRHIGYCEPFRFDVTDALKDRNVLAVRVISGPRYGEPVAYWSILPDMISEQDQRYTRDPARSIPRYAYPSQHLGSGYGLHREVFLETTGEASVAEIFARADLPARQATATVQTDASSAGTRTLVVEMLPENFAGQAFRKSVRAELPQGPGRVTVSVPMPDAKRWSPDEPNLYRCRVTIKDADRTVDAKDALFGFRSFEMARGGRLPEGMFLLNGRPLLLRGTNLSPAMNLFWYWRQPEKMLDTILLLKAANFNAVRICQHISFPEVRELMDRMGMMSEQDQGGGNYHLPVSADDLARAVGALARTTYNNPGVVLLSFANENRFDPRKPVETILAIDPQRIIKPISGNGNPRFPPPGYSLPEALWSNVIDDFHCYNGWYGQAARIWALSVVHPPAARMVTSGEYGAEGLDAYETMKHYPPHLGPTPARTDDVLFGHTQTKKADARQIIGFRGKKPGNLGEYIEASQTYQADVLAEMTKGYRLSSRWVGGYFQFHFIDGLAAAWPKSIVSDDFTPKKGYYEMAQVNQPVVPLFQITDKGRAMDIYVANDLPEILRGHTVRWSVRHGGRTLVEGAKHSDVAALDAMRVASADLSAVGDDAEVVGIVLILSDIAGKTVSTYRREVFLKAWRLEDAVLPPKSN